MNRFQEQAREAKLSNPVGPGHYETQKPPLVGKPPLTHKAFNSGQDRWKKSESIKNQEFEAL